MFNQMYLGNMTQATWYMKLIITVVLLVYITKNWKQSSVIRTSKPNPGLMAILEQRMSSKCVLTFKPYVKLARWLPR